MPNIKEIIKIKIPKNQKVDKQKSKDGFALLFAVITASILLSIGLSVFNISLKELTLSTASRDSQIAFYSADSARECVVYWDLKHSAFKTCLSESCSGPGGSTTGEPIYCASKLVDVTITKNNGESIYKTDGKFFYLGEQEKLGTIPEANFTVTKEFEDSDIITTISVFGHNAELGERRIERGILQIY